MYRFWNSTLMRLTSSSSSFSNITQLTCSHQKILLSSKTLQFYHTRLSKHSTIVQHVRSVLDKYSDKYHPYLFDPEVNLVKNTEDNQLLPVTKKFIQYSQETDLKSLDDESYVNIISEIEEHVKQMSDQNIYQILYAMRNFPTCSKTEPNYMKLWACLDNECAHRSKEGWTIREIFTMDDAWANLEIYHDFYWKSVIKKLFKKAGHLSKEEFIRLMYSASRFKQIPKRYLGFELEFNYTRLFDELSLDEHVVVLSTFIRARKGINDPELVKKILELFIKHVDTLDSVGSSVVANCIRRFACFGNEKIILRFMQAFIPHVDRLNSKTCIAIASTGIQNNTIDYELLKAISKKLEDDVPNLPMKEIERLTIFAQRFNIDSNKVLVEKVINELKNPERKKEIQSLQSALPGILHYLSSTSQIYLEDLISHVLSKEFLKKNYGRNLNQYSYDIIHLDFNTPFENPNYSGNRLHHKIRRRLLKLRTFYFSVYDTQRSPSVVEIALQEVCNVLREMYNIPEYNFLLSSFLPHFHIGGGLFCTDRSGNPMEIPKCITDYEYHEPKIIPEDLMSGPIVFHYLCIVNRYNVIYNTKNVTGNTIFHEKIMKKLGYNVHRIYYDDWMAAENRQEFLKGYLRTPNTEQYKQEELAKMDMSV